MGNWVTISTAGVTGYTPPPDAPNIGSASCSAYYGMWANDSAYGLQGTINLPTSDPAYSHLKEIDISATFADGSSAPVQALYAAFSGSTVTFKGECGFAQGGSSASVTLTFRCKNDVGIVTPSPLTVSVTIQASAVTSITSAAEVSSSRYATTDTRLVRLKLGFVPVLNAGQVPQNVTYFFSDDNGTSWVYIGWTKVATVGQQLVIDRTAPGVSVTNWKVAAVAGAVGGDPTVKVTSLPGGAIASSSISIAGLAAPASGVVTGISAGTITAHVDHSSGWQWAELDGVNWTDPTDMSWLVKFYVRETDSGGSPASDAKGSWREWFEKQVVGGARTSIASNVGPLQITYRAAADTHHYLQIQCVAVNRLSTNPGDWAGTDTVSSVAQGSVIQLNFGALPAAGLLADRIDPTTLGQNLAVDASGKPTVPNPLDGEMLLDPGFDLGLSQWAVSSPPDTTIVSYAGAQSPPNVCSISGAGNYISQAVAARAGELLHVSAWFYPNASYSMPVAIYLAYYDSSWAAIGSLAAASGTAAVSAWTQVVLDPPQVPPGTTHTIITIQQGSSTGALFVDLVSCRRQVTTGQGLVPDGRGGVQTYALQLQDGLINGGFEDGFSGWVVTGSPYLDATPWGGVPPSGKFCVSIAPHATIQPAILTSDTYQCKPGETYWIKARIHGYGCDATLLFWRQWIDSLGASTWDYSLTDFDCAVYSSWQDVTFAVVVPAGKSYLKLSIGCHRGGSDFLMTTGYWTIDNISIAKQIPVGAGAAIDAAGALKVATADGLTIVSGLVAPNLGGGLRINPTTHLIEANNVDVTAFASTVRPVSIFATNPTLPSANYPAGSFGFNTAGASLQKVNAAGTAWVAAITSADTDSSVVSASYLTANYLTAGAISAAYVAASYLAANYITASAIAASYATFSYLSANYASFTYLSANYATIGALAAKTIDVGHLTAGSASISGSGSVFMTLLDSGSSVALKLTPAGLVFQNSSGGLGGLIGWDTGTSQSYVSMYSLSGYSATLNPLTGLILPSVARVSIGGNQILTVRQTDPGLNTSTTLSFTPNYPYTAAEAVMIAALRDQCNALRNDVINMRSLVKTHGLLS